MNTKISSPEITLSEVYPSLRGDIQEGGWVTLHNKSFAGQRTSLDALSHLHIEGFNFDIETNDGKLLQDVNLNDAHVKLEYNVAPAVETFPANGINCWRLSSRRRIFPNPTFANKGYFEGTVCAQGPIMHYANDKYKREIKPGVFVDVYDVIDCFEVTSGALQHAIKKLLAAGKRGHKDYEQDLIDILSSVERALFQYQEKTK